MFYDVYSKFNLKKHKQTFINYLEVIIDEKAIVHYAVPSHQEKLISLISEHYYLTRQEVLDSIPRDKWFDFTNALCEKYHMICVWSCGYKGNPNKEQQKVLLEFINENIMKDVKI